MAARLVPVSSRSLVKTLTTHCVARALQRCLHQRLFATGQFQNVIVERRGKKHNVGVVKLNRPRAFNALNDALMTDLTLALQQLDQDKDVGCIVITGSDRAFSVGADVAEMGHKTYQDVVSQDFPAQFCSISRCRKPVIAAVNGYALGGGCEVAMMCDIIYAGHKAQFAQPEITLGTIPDIVGQLSVRMDGTHVAGAGGTQRLPRAVGKSRAMELVLTGDRINAQQAEQMGLVSKVLPAAELLDAAVCTAEKIAGFSPLAVAMCKETVNASQELPLAAGLHLEKLLSRASISTDDTREGVSAFVEKREASFTGK